MHIYRTFDDTYYNKKSLLLGNCINVKIDDLTYHYEFIINGTTAIINCDNLMYIENAITFFRNHNRYITTFSTENNDFYLSFEPIPTFKLPINIIQPTGFFLNKKKIHELKDLFNDNLIYLPVTIINDEYVLLDGHHRLYIAYLNDQKMVNVYMDDDKPIIHDFLYLAKEQNITHIKDLPKLDSQTYDNIIKELMINLNN